MKKTFKKLTFICALCCAFCTFAAPIGFSLPTPSPIVATAEKTSSLQLISPPSYEQYLPLKEPKDGTASAQFTAVADGKTLYIYDKKANTYRVYEHAHPIIKIQFDKSETLYFLDNATALYTIDPIRLETVKTSIVCSNFLIAEETLYFTNTLGTISGIRMIALDSLQEGTPTVLKEKVGGAPALAYEKGELYFTSGENLRKINPLAPADIALVAVFPFDLTAILVIDNLLFCTTLDGDYRAYDLHDFNEENEAEKIQPLFVQSGNFFSLSHYEKHVYTVNGNSLQRFSLDGNGFDGFQITSASSAPDRTDGASDICLSDKYLFIADNNNKRISVYNTINNSFSAPIDMDITPNHIATNGTSVLIASKTQILIYNLKGVLLHSNKDFEGNVIGATSVEDGYYLVTNKNEFIHITPPQKGSKEWTPSKQIKTSTKYSSLLTSDAYGNLYVRCNNSVYEYTKEEFMSPDASTKEVFSSLPDGTKEIALDYSGNLYALEGTVMHKYVRNKTNGLFEEKESFDWTGEQQVCATSNAPKTFVLSISENAAFVLDENNYIIKRTDLKLPTLKNIPVNGVDGKILQSDYSEFEVVTIKQNSFVIRFDFENLNGAEYFPYQSYENTTEELRGIRLATAGEYEVLAVYTNNAYQTYLTYSYSCENVEKSTYYTPYTEEEQYLGELSSEVGVYKLPFLSSPFSQERLSRGKSVKVKGKVTSLNLDYYFVEYTPDEHEGTSKTGYIPCAYVSEVRGDIPSQHPHQGKSDGDKGSVGRLIYLLLGFGVVCILTDYLILKDRKPKEDDIPLDQE